MARKPELGNVQLYPNRNLTATDKNGYVLKFYCPIRGKRIRKNCGTRNRRDARRLQRECSERLLNGQYVRSGGAVSTEEEELRVPEAARLSAATAEERTWSDCSELYRSKMKRRTRPRTHQDTTYRLGLAERIFETQRVKQGLPAGVLLTECMTLASLEHLQESLLDGEEGKYDQRSPNSVNSIMASVMGFVRYCYDHEWIDRVPPLKKLEVDEVMRGRPITGEEFDRMLVAAVDVVGQESLESWQFTLKVIWESGFRIEDVMDFSWDDLNCIHPIWPRRKNQHPTIAIPSSQKNRKLEEIPMLPGLADLLDTVPKKLRHGWVVNPLPVSFKMKGQKSWFMPDRGDLATLLPTYSNCSIARACGVSEQTVRNWVRRYGLSRENRASLPGADIPDELVSNLRERAVRTNVHQRRVEGRLTVERVGKVIAMIGEQAGIVVRSPRQGDEGRTKYASAHDLRRGCAQRLINSGVSAETLKVVMRHREFSTTERYYGATRRAQSAATELHHKLDIEATRSQLTGAENKAPELSPADIRKLKALLNSI